MTADIRVRRARAADEAEVLALLRTALGWADDEVTRQFFRWKHYENPAGPSLAFVAEADGKIVGFRPFLRWLFRRGTEEIAAVRAVDAATHPSRRRAGVFAQLTSHAIDDLSAEGCAFIFNTPNDKSWSGEAKLGWSPIGRPGVTVTVAGPASVTRLLRARSPAERWSLPTDAGDPAVDVLRDVEDLQLPGACATTLSTVRRVDYLRWRYGFAPLHYRVLTLPDGSLAVFRVRRRGDATEVAVCEISATRTGTRQLVKALLRATNANYAICLGRRQSGLPLPRVGPLLVHRPLAGSRRLVSDDLALTLGDIELF